MGFAGCQYRDPRAFVKGRWTPASGPDPTHDPGAILVVDGRPESRAGLVRAVKEAEYSSWRRGPPPRRWPSCRASTPSWCSSTSISSTRTPWTWPDRSSWRAPTCRWSSSPGLGDTDLVVKGMRTGAYDFLVKPVAGRTLKEVSEGGPGPVRQPAVLPAPGGNGGDASASPPWTSTCCSGTASACGRWRTSSGAPPTPMPRSCCRARAAPARRWWPGPSTTSRTAGTSRSSRSTAPPCPATCSNPSCSATRRAPSRGPTAASRASSSWPTGAPSSWTRSARCRSGCRPSCSTCSRTGSSSGWAAAR